VTWVDARNGALDLYAQKIGPDRPVPTFVQAARGWWSGRVVELSWSLDGDDGASFEVERSVEGTEWRSIGSAEAGNARGSRRFTDAEPVPAATNQYRLRRPGSSWTDGEIEVRVPGTAEFQLRGVVPNPVATEMIVTLHTSQPGPVAFEVSDLQGRIVSRRAWQATAGGNSFHWAGLDRLQAGAYWLRASQGTMRAERHFVVTR
jgi:hypothetical protein